MTRLNPISITCSYVDAWVISVSYPDISSPECHQSKQNKIKTCLLVLFSLLTIATERENFCCHSDVIPGMTLTTSYLWMINGWKWVGLLHLVYLALLHLELLHLMLLHLPLLHLALLHLMLLHLPLLHLALANLPYVFHTNSASGTTIVSLSWLHIV